MADILTELRLEALESGKPVDQLALLERARNLLADKDYFSAQSQGSRSCPEVDTVRGLLDYAIVQIKKTSAS